jgi:hypothetical protein
MSVVGPRTQALMREVNDRIYETLASMGTEDGDFLCECGDEDCSERIQVTHREYRALRTALNPAVLRSAAHS